MRKMVEQILEGKFDYESGSLSFSCDKLELLLKKEQQYGTYVSLIPLTTQVTGVTLTGFKYPLTGHTLGGFSSLAVSNEIVEEEGVIELQDGILVLAESMD